MNTPGPLETFESTDLELQQQTDAAQTTGYRTVFKASSLLGGSQGICYVLGVARTKALAYLLGPSGIGLLSLYGSVAGTIGTFAGMGIGESSIREVAAAKGNGDPRSIDITAKVVRRSCFLSGLLGLLICVVFGAPISKSVFGNSSHSVSIALLGITLLLGAMTSAEISLIQGTGHVSKLARLSIISSLAALAPVIFIYAWMGMDGIIPSLLLAAVLSYIPARMASRGIADTKAKVSWMETLTKGKTLLSLGFAFMLTGLLWAGKDMLIRSSITNSFGLDATGIYQAAWAISGLFVNFVLRAMGMDFYPRLTAINHDPEAMRLAVCQQIEVGTLLALPGVIATVGFSPLIIKLLYSSAFAPASILLTILACGVFFKVVSYPLNTIQLAKGDAKGFAAIGMLFGAFELGISLLLLSLMGLVGLALAYPISTFLHVLGMLWVGKRMISFKPSKAVAMMFLVSILFIGASLLIALNMPETLGLVLGFGVTTASAVYCIRGLSSRLGEDHRLVRLALKLPFGRWMFT
jgi:antigen flippase